MRIACEAQGGVPAVGICECGSAVELDRDVTPCLGCWRHYDKAGAMVTREGKPSPSDTLQPEYTLPTGARLKTAAMIGLAISAVQKRWQRRRKKL